MSWRKLLCIYFSSASMTAAVLEALSSWDVSAVNNLVGARKALKDDPYPVGLLFFNDADDIDVAKVETLLDTHQSTQWVGIFSPKMLELPLYRELIVGHLFDFHTLPVDPLLLNHTLGHAYGYAKLNQQQSDLHPSGHNMALIGKSPPIQQLRRQIAKVARADAPVLIWGESGSGKELAAHAIHNNSPRSNGPFVAVNCGAIPATLIQSELFGYERGAFTGAAKEKRGVIESAAGGTLFLDEIGDLPMDLQANLLRFLQERTINRIGSARSIEVDVRVIAATHIHLEDAVRSGQFREDLFYRLNVLPLKVPPLRERKEDLELLVEHFFKKFETDKNPRLKGFSRQAMRTIAAYDWPGNVRELINCIRRAMVLAEGRLITPEDLLLHLHLHTHPPPPSQESEALQDARLRAEREAISQCLRRNGNNITQAARELGVSRMTLYRLMKKNAIDL